MGYLTPNTSPADKICRALFIPNDPEFLANVRGALEELTFAYNWDKFGALTPQQAADAFVPMFDQFCFNQGVCRVIGEIIAYAGAVSPDSRWLACNGDSVLRSAYPDLFDAIGTVYGAVDGTHFNLPDLRDRVNIGAGLTYSQGDSGGESSHTLVTSEIPAHNHTDNGHLHTDHSHLVVATLTPVGAIPISTPNPLPGTTGSANADIQNTGGDGAHNNLQPYLAITFLIVALE